MSAALLCWALWAEPAAAAAPSAAPEAEGPAATTVTVEEEVDLGALEEAAVPTERARAPWLLVLPGLAAGLLLWNTELRRTSR